jgi:hypothetical protein
LFAQPPDTKPRVRIRDRIPRRTVRALKTEAAEDLIAFMIKSFVL